MSKFDTHAHVFIKGLPLAEKCRYVPDYDATVKNYLEHLDQHGIDIGILIQPSFLGTDNHFLLNALEHHPHRLRGVVVVDTDISFFELQKMDQLGVIGIRLNLIGQPLPDFTTPEWITLLSYIKSLNWHVELHRTAQDLPALITSLLAQGVKVVIDHFGLPDTGLMQNDPNFQAVLKSAQSGRVWIKISGGYRNGGAGIGEQKVSALIPTLLSHFGAERLLWGSDWPHTRFENAINYSLTIKTLNEWIPDQTVREQILSQAPEELITVK